MRKICPLSFLSLIVSVCALAQDSTNVTFLQEVIVSASRTEQPVIEIPRSVAVIHEHEIRNSIYQSLGELLNVHSGLYVVGASQTPGTNQTIFMRGSNSNQVAVLIDGIRITDASSPNAAIDLSEISLANVERIEVIRGSHSTMFGGSAIGGVINVITRKKAATGLHGNVSWQGGSLGQDAWSSTENLALDYGTKSGLYFNGALFRQDVRGLDASEKSAISPSYTSDRDDFCKTDASVKAGFKNGLWDANISFRKANQYTDIDNGAFSDDDNSYLIFDRGLFQYYGGYKVNTALRFALLGSVSDSERFYENDSSRVSPAAWDKVYSTGTYYGNLQTHELQLNYDKEDFRGVFGGGIYREKMFFESYFLYNDPAFPFESTTNYDTINTQTTTRYIFAQLGFGFDNFDIAAGARFSSHTTAGDFFTLEVNPSYAVKDVLFYGSFSTGYNAPSLYQLYDPSKGFTAHTTRGNRNLEPEQSLSLEGGIKKQFSSGSYLTLSAYQTKVIRSIEYVYLWNGAKSVADLDYSDDRGDTYINVAEQVVKGLELETGLNLTSQLSFRGNISVLKAQIRADADDVDAAHTGSHHVQLYNLGTFLTDDFERNDVVRRPSVTGFARMTYQPADDLTFQASWRYAGRRYDAGYDATLGPYGALARIDVDAYHLMDMDVNWMPAKNISIACRIENLFNADYREVVGFQTRGRSVYLKVSTRF